MKTIHFSGAAAIAAAIAVTAPAAAQDFTIVNARLIDGTGAAERSNTTITVRNGRVANVGSGGAAGGTVVDAQGAYVTPGLVAAGSVLGLVEVGGVASTNETRSSKSPYSAALDMADAINPASTAIGVARIEGVTRAVVSGSPSGDLFGGFGAAISLDATDPTPLMNAAAFQVIDMGENGARRAGGSRAAAFARLEDALSEAAAYARAPARYGDGRSEDSLLTRADAAALSRVIDGSAQAMINVDRASDIRRVLQLRSDYPRMKIVLAGVAEGWLVADEIAAANVPVVAVPMRNLPASFETLAATQSNIGRMVAAGVKVGVIDAGGPSVSPQLPQQAGQLVAQGRIPGATGLSHEQAIAAITSIPADIFGLTRSGRITPGARADIVIWDGDPLETASAPTAIWIDGNEQPMTSRQTKLAERYNPANADTGLPKHYTRPR
ncbi:amidohydrolase family protein [Pacificimonas sp. WHA3]|uniref:Amidohydrolase family protein n=1 Tax=Pacificimonas pallii TaxID=2827236 RepID=A0ABS6SGZ0_9SPHN|nr:amidohydrolase family protein [Pacificimonas pallii]MBV7257693.1 amidohydrolase family protein [Pacificimonas pallii]